MRSYALLLVSALALTSAAAFAETSAPATTTPAAPAATETTPATPPAVAGISSEIGKLVEIGTVPALQNILKPGAQIRYVGDEHGLKAYFVTNENRGQIVYITPDGQASFMGVMYTADGVSMSMLQLTRLRMAGFDPLPYLSGSANGGAAATPSMAASPPATGQTVQSASPAPARQFSLGEQLLADAGQTSWLAFGAPTGVPVTVFMDPNCDHCHVFFKQILPYAQQNKVYLRVIPVSVVSPQKSGADVINLLSSPNPQELWIKLVMNGEAIPAVQTPNTQAATSLRLNNQTFSRWQLPGTPYSVYKDASGTVKVLYSEPENIEEFIKEIGAN